MIKITIKGGTRDGEVIEISEEIEPTQFLEKFVLDGIDWKLCLGSATIKEKALWGHADLSMRCARAFVSGRVIKFQGKTFQAQSRGKKEMESVINKLGDAVTGTNKFIFVESDTEKGLVIGISEPTYAYNN